MTVVELFLMVSGIAAWIVLFACVFVIGVLSLGMDSVDRAERNHERLTRND